MIIINDDYRLLSGGKVKEGGLARNEAMIRWLKENRKAEEISLDKDRISNALTTLKTLRRKNEEILLFYPTVGIPVLKNGIAGKISSGLFFHALRKACRRNRMIMDICDLKYEQSIDLELEPERRLAIKNVEKKLFASDCDFVFASGSMRDYAKEKYRIKDSHCFVIDNGGSLETEETDFQVDEQKINLVYAGTLNKGRNIETMLEAVRENRNAILYLCGTGGEWIRETDQIHYLGALDENKAHYVVSLCDLGLIPYDETRKYYNIAYPTKLSFYMTAGIPFLSTDVREVRKIYDRYGIGYIGSIEEWGGIIADIPKEKMRAEKNNIRDIMEEFTWEYKCKNSRVFQ